MAISRDEIERIVNNTKSSQGAQSTRAAQAPAQNPVMSMIDSVVQQQKKNSGMATVKAGMARDAETIKQYESIPSYGLAERLTDSSKKKAYDEKQALHDDYVSAQDRSARILMTQKGISESDLADAYVKSPSLDWITGEKDVLTDAIDKYITNPQKREAAEASLQSKGLTDAESELLKEYYKRASLSDSLQRVSDFADEHEVLGTLASFPSKIGGTLHSLAGNVGAYLTGNPIDSNSMWNVAGNSTDAMRAAASKDLSGAGKVAYDVGTSIGDMVPTIAASVATGGASALPMAVSGVSAFADSTREGAARGLTPNQIIGTGLANAAAEAALERIPLEGLSNIVSKGGKEATKSLVKELAGQMGREAVEEMGTEALTTFADGIINGDKSHFALNKQNYIAQGMSDEEATRQAYIDVAKGVGYSGLVGAVSGGVMGGGASALSRTLRALDPLNALGTKENTVEHETTTANAESGIHVGKATYIKSPYDGEKPVQSVSDNYRVEVPAANYNSAVQNIEKAKAEGSTSGKSIKTVLTKMYERIFPSNSTSKNISVNGVKFGNADYIVTVNKNVVGKVMSDSHMSAEKIAVLDSIDEIVSRANYVGSGNYVAHGSKNKHDVTRYDYFETPATINGEPYIVTFDVEVHPSTNNYRTHKVINEINLTKSPDTGPLPAADTQLGTDTGPLPAVPVDSSSLSTDSIPNSSQNVNVAGESTQRIAGFNELNQQLDRLVGMYKGNENTQALYSQMKAAVNEYLQTGNQGAIDRAVTLAAQIDESLVGHSYTRKGSGKNSATAQNNRVTTTFTEGEFVDTLFAYQRELRDAAQTTKAQNQEVPEQTTGGNQRVRGYNETLIQKTDAPQEVKNEFIENPDIYTQLSNATTLGRANEILANNDTSAAIAQYHSMLDAKDPAAVPLGYNLSKKLAQEGRLDESVQLVREMSRALTESGQFSQAAAITMLNNDPEAAKRYLIRELDTMNQKGKEQYGKKWKDFELTEAELKRFNDIKTGDTEGIKALYEDVYNRLRKEYPSTMTEKMLEYRRVAMLLNVRTNVRNVVSNALLFPVRWTADRVSALGEGAYSLINPEYNRTQSLNPFRSAESRKLASDAFETVRNELLGESKYEDAKGAVRDKQVFKGSKVARMLDTITNGAVTKANQAMGKDIDPSLMETAKNFTYWLLQKGDNFFVKKNFESRMASYIQAQGITDIENIPPDAYTLATQEALKATFKDDSAFANGLSAFRQMLNRAPGHFIGEAVMPFTKTPANLAMRGIDYSPAGVYNAVKTFQSAKNNGDVAKGLTQLGQAATGTAAIALGYVLAEMGFLKGALSDDKDEAQFQKQQGELAYSIKTPFGYLTYDWAQPASIPLILGVTIYDSLNNDRDLGAGLKQGALAAVDSWLELSPLQNLSDIFGGYGSPAENVWDVLSTDLPLSFLPAQMGAVAKIGDTTQRSTYDQTNYWSNLANQAKAKIPRWSETLPASYDTWGNPIQRQDNKWEAVLANLLNPGQFGNENVTPLDSEISRLYESTNDATVFPKKAAWTTNDVKLNNEQYSEYQRIMGSNAYDMVGAFMDSAVYGSLADDQRVDAIAQMYSFADALAKSKVAGYDVANHNTYKKAYAIYKDKGAAGVAEFYAIKQNTGGSTSNSAMVNAVSKAGISNEEKGYYIKQMLGDDIPKVGAAIYDDRGGAALYEWYSFCTANDVNGNSSKEKVRTALTSSELNDADKLYFYTMFSKCKSSSSSKTTMTLERIATIINSAGK